MTGAAGSATGWRLPARAKVNLALRVLGRRSDGYHEIETVMHALALHDDVVAAPAGELSLEIVSATAAGAPVVAGADNLVWRAAAAFFAAAGLAPGLRVHLTKRIPAGGGLGGGSSDAAATLRLCNALFGAPLDAATLHEVATGLGADVPFFLDGGTQVARGIGERLQPCCPPPETYYLLVVPPFGTSTAAVYKKTASQLTARCTETSIRGTNSLSRKGLETLLGTGNDLASAAFELHPELGELKDAIAARGCPGVRLSGSGATLFVAFPSSDERAAAFDRLSGLTAQGIQLVATESALGVEPAPEEVPWPTH